MSTRIYWWAMLDGRKTNGTIYCEWIEDVDRWTHAIGTEAERVGADHWEWHINDETPPAWWAQ